MASDNPKIPMTHTPIPLHLPPGTVILTGRAMGKSTTIASYAMLMTLSIPHRVVPEGYVHDEGTPAAPAPQEPDGPVA